MIRIRISKRPEFPSWIHFMRSFCRTESQVEQCLIIIQTIIDHNNHFPAKKWSMIPKSSVGMYTKCLKILRDNGLVSKRGGYYILSRDLLISLGKIIERWRELVNVVEKGEKILVR